MAMIRGLISRLSDRLVRPGDRHVHAVRRRVRSGSPRGSNGQHPLIVYSLTPSLITLLSNVLVLPAQTQVIP
jgi:hypothetical protein